MKRQNGFRRGFTLIELLACQPKPWRRQARAAFTLIELLVVIAIIGLLAAIIFSSLKGAMNAAKNARTMSQIQALDGAIKRYYAEYGKMPAPGTGYNGDKTKENTVFTGADQAKIIEILVNSSNMDDPNANPRQIAFVDLDPKSFNVKTLEEMLSKLDGGKPYPDPWWDGEETTMDDYAYGILMDFDFNGIIEGTDVGNIRAPVGVYSLGNPEKGYTMETTPYRTW
ncbi:MAG: type II secretion system protein [Spartobacteria bacterium]|nr:type II secretion system protein [Spartobacteria bacterium]